LGHRGGGRDREVDGYCCQQGALEGGTQEKWVMFMELVELRNCIEVSIIWIQDDRVVYVGPLGSWPWNVCLAFKMFEESSISDWGAISHSLDIKRVPEGCKLVHE
jgi:hypothetical protein